MIIVCSYCSTRLQVNEAKFGSAPFSLRCPKCQRIITGELPAPERSAAARDTPSSSGETHVHSQANSGGAFAAGNNPALTETRYRKQKPAPMFLPDEPATAQSAQGGVSSDVRDVAAQLLDLLQQGTTMQEAGRGNVRLGWERRKALVCAPEARRGQLARALTNEGYQVFVAADLEQALDRMRDERMSVVVLDCDFAATEKGAVYITREIQNLRPSERRRMLFVWLAPDARTLDAHAAFLQNVNLLVNTKDADYLPAALERTIRHYNELYKDFFNALQVAAV